MSTDAVAARLGLGPGGASGARARDGGIVVIGLVAACDDPQLFGIDLWDVQRALLAAVEAGPRIHIWALGRRSAKTTSAAIVGLWDALFRPELDRLVLPGERRHVVCVAVNLRQARLFVQQARAIVERSPLLAELARERDRGRALFPERHRAVRVRLLIEERARLADLDASAR